MSAIRLPSAVPRGVRNPDPKGPAAGFTLIELMVTVSILAILLGIGVPSFQDFVLSSRLRAVSNDLLSSAQLARSEAIKRNANVVLCVSSNGTTCGSGDWNQGWIVAATTGGEVIQRREPAPSGYRVIGSTATITFQSTGLAQGTNNFKVCRQNPTVGSQERTVAVWPGRTSVTRPNPSSGTCP